MKLIYKKGDQKIYKTKVAEADLATFHGKVLHKVCSTFSLARDMEWSSRLFFIDMKDADEEGLGTYLEIKHLSPAFVGDELIIKAEVDEINGNELMCTIEVRTEDRLIAIGKTGQRMLKIDRLRSIFTPPS